MKKVMTFTLIEFLVIIAIIAIFASILLPALNQARDKTRTISCLNNEKQLGMAMNMHNSDYSDYSQKAITYKDGRAYFRTEAFWEFKYLAQKMFVCSTSMNTFPPVNNKRYMQKLEKGILEAGSAGWQYGAYGINSQEMGGRNLTDNGPY